MLGVLALLVLVAPAMAAGNGEEQLEMEKI